MEWLVTFGAAGALLLTVAGSMMRAHRRAGAWQDRVEARWREVAAALGGTLEVSGKGSLTPRRLTLSIQTEDARATLEANVPVDAGAPGHTYVRARFALGRGPAFRMRERAGAEPGQERDVFADGPLVRRVRVDAEHTAATAALFGPSARAHAAAFLRPIDLRSDGSTLELVWEGTEVDPDAMAHALGLVRELAGFGASVLRPLSELDGARYVPIAEGGPAVRVVRAGVDVALVARSSETGLSCAAQAEPSRPLPELDVKIGDDGALEGTLPPGVLDPELAPCLAEVGACTLSSEPGQLELRWIDPPDARQADAAVRLLASIAAGSGRQGAFR